MVEGESTGAASAARDERAAYLDTPDGRIYSVLHRAGRTRRGAVLVCGPIGAERERAYPTLVAWARTLAAAGFDAMRFDYRGTGESEGAFEEMTVSAWREDTARAAAALAAIVPGTPVVLHGTRLGCVIAADLFASGTGDALLLWTPPLSAAALLSDMMRRAAVSRMMTPYPGPVRSREEQVAAIEAGELVNVDGYFWSRAFWDDAKRHELALPGPQDLRPWRVVDLARAAAAANESRPGGHRVSVACEPFWDGADRLVPSSDALFRTSATWLEEALLGRGS